MPELLSAPGSTDADRPEAAGYLRADLFVPAEGSREAFNFGVWVSLEAEELVKYLTGETPPGAALRGRIAGAAARIRLLADGGAPAVELVDSASAKELAALLQAV